jgi:hypothetical protein
MPLFPSARSFRRTSTPKYDPSIRDYPIEQGLTVDVHPVDQRVTLLMCTLKGKIAGDPETGLEVGGRSGAGTEASKALWQRRVLAALEPAVVDRDISVEGIVVTFPKRGEVAIDLSYRNLRLPEAQQARRAPFTFGGS